MTDNTVLFVDQNKLIVHLPNDLKVCGYTHLTLYLWKPLPHCGSTEIVGQHILTTARAENSDLFTLVPKKKNKRFTSFYSLHAIKSSQW